MGKKSYKNKEKIVHYYSLEERSLYINEIKIKLESIGLLNYDENMTTLNNNFNSFVEHGTEFNYSFQLEGAKRKCIVKLLNNKQYIPSINLIYDENI